MDREILFRGRTIKTRYFGGEWIEGFFVMSRAGRAEMEPAIITGTEKGCFMTEFVDPATVGQFTGLCDKNGVKIFEGDIVFAGYGEYYQGQHEHSATMIIDMADYEALNALCNANVVEVIGNIHDTPDLETKEESE
jgi:uncharacterized phage protein (TIGR01671 family)